MKITTENFAALIEDEKKICDKMQKASEILYFDDGTISKYEVDKFELLKDFLTILNESTLQVPFMQIQWLIEQMDENTLPRQSSGSFWTALGDYDGLHTCFAHEIGDDTELNEILRDSY